jgi:hypothetical protein
VGGVAEIEVWLPGSGGCGPIVSDAGFESPVVGASGFQYHRPAPLGVLPGRESAATAALPPATRPHLGNSGGVLTGWARLLHFTNHLGLSSKHQLHSHVFGAQRGNCCNDGGQDFQVYLDDLSYGTFHPTGTSYADYSTIPFTTTAGTHTLKFYGLNPLGGDHTAFIAT